MATTTQRGSQNETIRKNAEVKSYHDDDDGDATQNDDDDGNKNITG